MQITFNNIQRSCLTRYVRLAYEIAIGKTDSLIEAANIHKYEVKDNEHATIHHRFHKIYNLLIDVDDIANTKVHDDFLHLYDLNNMFATLNDNNLELSLIEAGVLYESIENVARIEMGQYNCIRDLTHNCIVDDIEGCDKFEKKLRDIFMSELSYNASYGVGNGMLPPCNAVIWDIRDHLRFHFSWLTKPWGGWTVNFDTPSINWSGQPPIQIIHDDINDNIYILFVKRFKSSIIKVTEDLIDPELTKKIDEIKKFAIYEFESIHERHEKVPNELYNKVFETEFKE